MLIRRLILILGILGQLMAQDTFVSGKVLNAENHAPIHGANVFSSDLGTGTVSQVDGQFILKGMPLGKVEITFSMMGYKDIETVINIQKDMNDLGTLFMVIDTLKIDQINVSAHQDLLPTQYASSSHIFGKKYQENLKGTLAQTLNNETGLSIRTMGQATSKPVLRGYTGDRFLLTEDGITVGDLSNTSIDHAISMDMASFNNIRIIRGPESLLYGSNTIGGVINVSRQANTESKFHKTSVWGLLGTESSNQSTFGNMVIYIPIQSQHQFKFTLLNRETNDQKTPLGVLGNTALTNNEISGSYSYFRQADRSTISLEHMSMDYGIPGSYEGHINGVDIHMEKNTQKINYHRDISFLGFQTFDIDQRFIMYKHNEIEKGHSFPSVKMNQSIFSLQNKLTGNHLTAGSLFQYRHFKAGGFYWTPDTREINIALFGLYEKDYNSFTLQASSRAEYLTVIPDKSSLFLSNLDVDEFQNRTFPIITGALGVIKQVNHWKMSLGTMFAGRTPSIENLYSDGPHLGTYAYEIGQPALDLERTIGLESSIEYHNNTTELKVTGYHNYSPNFHISTKMGDGYVPGADWIEWGSGSSGWLYKYQMKGLKSKIYGFESDFSHQVGPWLSFYGNMSITRGENITEQTPLAYMPPDKISVSTAFDLGLLSIIFQFQKVLPQTRLGEFETPTDGCNLTNINGSYAIYTTRLTHKIIFQVDNVFDSIYYNHLSRIKRIMPEKGRSIGLQYRIVF